MYTVLGIIAKPMGLLLDLLYGFIGSYGISIIIFTVFVKLCLYPLYIKQTKSTAMMSEMQPKMQAIQKKYKNKKDQDSMLKQQQEVQEIYRKYDTSMTNGCLVSFIQLPIIYGLYRVIYNIPAYVDSVKEMYRPISEQIAKIDDYKTVLSTFVTEEKVTTATRAVKMLTDLDETKIPARYTIYDYITNVISQFSVSQLAAFRDANAGAADGLASVMTNGITEIDKWNTFLGINISEAPGWFFSGGIHFTPAMIYCYYSSETYPPRC